MRNLHINDKTYKYCIGKSYIRITSPNKKSETFIKELFNFEQMDSEDARDWSGEGEHNFPTRNIISPQKIKDFIIKSNL